MKIKFLLFVLFLLFVTTNIYADIGGTLYENTQNIEWSYEGWETQSDTLTFITPPNNISQGGPFSYSGEATYPVQSGYAVIFLFPNQTEDYVFLKAPTDLSISGIGGPTSFFFPTYAATELNTPVDRMQVNFNEVGGQIQLTSNLKPLQAGGQNMVNAEQVIPHLLEKYYYMKTLVYAVAVNENDEVVNWWYPQNTRGNYDLTVSDSILSNINEGIIDSTLQFTSGDDVKYVLAKPDDVTISFDTDIMMENLSNMCNDVYDFCGNYRIDVRAFPIDRKGAFGGDGTVELDDIQSHTITLIDELSVPTPLHHVEIIELSSVDRNKINFTISRNGYVGAIPLQFEFTRIPVHPKEWEMNQSIKKINNTLDVTLLPGIMPEGDASVNVRDNSISVNGSDYIQVIEFSPSFNSTYAGEFNVMVRVDHESHSFEDTNTQIGKFFCQNNDGTCDSVIDEEDICPLEFGTPFYAGCAEPSFEMEDGLKAQKVLLEPKSYNVPFWETRYFDYDSQNDVISCNGGTWRANYLHKDGVLLGSSFNSIEELNPSPGNYECKSWEGFLLASATIGEELVPSIVSVSVFDLDRDNVPFHPTWWQNRFPNEEIPELQDLCPASYGVVENFGCPSTNKELTEFQLREVVGDLVTFPDFNTEKIFVNPQTNSIFVGGSRTSLSGLESLNPNLVNVEITSTCVPSIPISQIIRNDQKLASLIDVELRYLFYTKERAELEARLKFENINDFDIDEIQKIQSQIEDQVVLVKPVHTVDDTNSMADSSAEESLSIFSTSEPLDASSVKYISPEDVNLSGTLLESSPKFVRVAIAENLNRGSASLPSERDLLNAIEKIRLEELGIVSNLPESDVINILDYLAKVSDCDVPLQRLDELDIFSLTSTLHLLTLVDDIDYTRDVLNSIITTANQLEISKRVDPSISLESITTNITLNINNIPQDTTIWQVIPKESVRDFERLRNSIRQGNADEIRIKDRDPIIGWYFGEPGSSGDIGFEIDGTGEGGSTIPIQDTLFFNYGELIVNYREFGCFDLENELFKFQSITDSEVGFTNYTYSVCIAHNSTHTINSSAPLTELYFGIENRRLTQNMGSVQLFKQNSSELGFNTYYAMYYGRTPPRMDYSCIGSIDELSGLFGGCMYRPNTRLWMYYGIDPHPPEIDLFYIPSHSIQPRLTIFDEISGLEEIGYCITDSQSEECSIYTPINIPPTFMPAQNLVEYIVPTIECPDVRDCEKYIRVYARDVEGHTTWHNETLTLLQEATSCSSSCLAQPMTGRYLASCHRISGCEFMGLDFESEEDQGLTVAQMCNYRVEGSWAPFDPNLDGGAYEGREVLCPSGPIRESRFSSIPFGVNSNECDDLINTRIPVVIDGEEVFMHIITC